MKITALDFISSLFSKFCILSLFHIAFALKPILFHFDLQPSMRIKEKKYLCNNLTSDYVRLVLHKSE